MAKYSRGKYAFGFCDRTGFRYKLEDLVFETVNGAQTGMRVGKDVVDKDHPQNFIGRVVTSDPQSLMNPRPDTRIESLFAWEPVANEAVYLTMNTNKVSVSTS